MNLGRRAALLAGLPETTRHHREPLLRVDLQTIRMAFHAVKSGEGDASSRERESTSQVEGYPKDRDELHPKPSATTRDANSTSRWA